MVHCGMTGERVMMHGTGPLPLSISLANMLQFPCISFVQRPRGKVEEFEGQGVAGDRTCRKIHQFEATK
jgi:hypothetical protein